MPNYVADRLGYKDSLNVSKLTDMELFRKHHELAMKKGATKAGAELETFTSPRTAKHLKGSKMPPLGPPGKRTRSKNQSAFRTPLPKTLRDQRRESYDASPPQANYMFEDRFRNRHKSLNADANVRGRLGFGRHAGQAPGDDHESALLDSNASTQRQDYLLEEEAKWHQKPKKVKDSRPKGEDKVEALDAINKEYQRELQGLELDDTIPKEMDIEEEI